MTNTIFIHRRFVAQCAVVFFLSASCAFPGTLKLYSTFSDGAVLQRNQPIKVWGEGQDGMHVKVQLAGQTAETTVESGEWAVLFPSMSAGGPYELSIESGDARIVRRDILIGDVWLCGGQSNMATPLRWYVQRNGRPDGKWKIFEEAFAGVPDNCRNSRIRYINIKEKICDVPPREPALAWEQWKVLTPESARELSATACFFARKLQSETGVPIGIVMNARSGTPIAAWLPWSVLDSKPLYRPVREEYEAALVGYADKKKIFDAKMAAYRLKHGLKPGDPLGAFWKDAPQIPYGPEHFRRPTGLYNGMVAPLRGLKFAGIVWYQGEDDTASMEAVDRYRQLLPDLVCQWRACLEQDDLPFLYVQLPSFRPGRSNNRIWPAMRDAQAAACKRVANAYMTVAIDAGLEDDIHPPYKQIVGERLAQSALANVYHLTEIGNGLRFRHAEFESNTVTISFFNADNGLMVGSVDKTRVVPASADVAVQGFSLAGNDQIFHPAEAVLSGNQVIVKSEHVLSPVAVRYAWEDVSPANLYNREELPAAPFSADRDD